MVPLNGFPHTMRQEISEMRGTMTCSNRNLLRNGGFRKGLAPWYGIRIKRVPNPIYKNDWSVIMDARNKAAVLAQKVQGTFEHKCAYYLYFRSYNITPKNQKALLYAVVSYLDAKGKTLRTTPLQINPSRRNRKQWSSYFTIVPPPPRNTKSINVVFLLKSGILYVDYIRIASHEIKT